MKQRIEYFRINLHKAKDEKLIKWLLADRNEYDGAGYAARAKLWRLYGEDMKQKEAYCEPRPESKS